MKIEHGGFKLLNPGSILNNIVSYGQPLLPTGLGVHDCPHMIIRYVIPLFDTPFLQGFRTVYDQDAINILVLPGLYQQGNNKSCKVN